MLSDQWAVEGGERGNRGVDERRLRPTGLLDYVSRITD